MATEILNLLKGNPDGSSKSDEYEFEKIILEGENEAVFLQEIAEYQLEYTTEYWVDHDEYGKYLDDVSISYNPLTDVIHFCFIYEGHFAGIAFPKDIHFVKTGVILGNSKSSNSWWVNSRRMDNSISDCKLVKVNK